jgi:hypothetical protein
MSCAHEVAGRGQTRERSTEACKTRGIVADGQSVWSWHPLLAAVRIRINLAEIGEGRCHGDTVGKVRRDGIPIVDCGVAGDWCDSLCRTSGLAAKLATVAVELALSATLTFGTKRRQTHKCRGRASAKMAERRCWWPSVERRRTCDCVNVRSR